MGVGGHGHAGGRGQSTKKKKRNELLVFVLLPQQCPSCTEPAEVAKADLLLESQPDQGRDSGCWGQKRL